MILSGILWLLTWPLVIFATYYAIKWVLKKYKNELEEVDE